MTLEEMIYVQLIASETRNREPALAGPVGRTRSAELADEARRLAAAFHQTGQPEAI